MLGHSDVEDKKGECNARLFIGDDFGDNCATIRCQLEPGHDGPHQEKYITNDSNEVAIHWTKDERTKEEIGF
jgi:hypothetical protein